MPFILNDEDYKSKYRMELKSAVIRARASPGALLKGLDIWLATNVQPPINTLSAIVKSAGGNVSRSLFSLLMQMRFMFGSCQTNMCFHWVAMSTYVFFLMKTVGDSGEE